MAMFRLPDASFSVDEHSATAVLANTFWQHVRKFTDFAHHAPAVLNSDSATGSHAKNLEARHNLVTCVVGYCLVD